MAADPTNFCWVFHVEFLLEFSYGFSVGLDSIFIDFGLGLGWVFLQVWVDYELGFPVGLAWFFFFLAWFELGFLMVCLIWCWFWINFVVDHQLLKWVAVVMVGWCWVGGLMFVIFLFLLGYYGRWEREGCWVAVAVRKERENLKGEREKIRNYWCT